MRDRFALPGTDLNLTAMIDVVFLLMVYFLFSLKPTDALADFEVQSAPAWPRPAAAHLPTLLVHVERSGYRLEGRPATRAELDDRLRQAAELDPGQGVRIACDPAAPHQALVHVLDACAAHGLHRLSVQTSPAER